jgi:hypothetical protein
MRLPERGQGSGWDVSSGVAWHVSRKGREWQQRVGLACHSSGEARAGKGTS